MTNNQETKEKRREIALKNVGADHLRDLAVAYFVAEGNNHGERDNAVAESHLYHPAMTSDLTYIAPNGDEINLLADSLVNSRQGADPSNGKTGQRYTGSVTEYKILETAGKIVAQSLGSLTVGDILDQVNYSGPLVEGIDRDAYLSDLVQGDDEEKALAQLLGASFQTYLTNEGLSRAFGQEAEGVRGDLELLLGSDDENVIPFPNRNERGMARAA